MTTSQTDDTRKILEIVQNLQTQLSSFQRSTEQRFDAVDQKFGIIDQQFEIVMEQFGAVREEIKDAIDEAKEEMMTRMDVLAEKQRCDTNDVVNQIRSLQDDKIDNHEQRIRRLETQVA